MDEPDSLPRPWSEIMGDSLTSGLDDLFVDQGGPERPLTLEDIHQAMAEIKRAAPDPHSTPASLTGRRQDMFDLLITMGCSVENDEDGGVIPAPVAMGTLGIDLYEKEQAPIGVVTCRNMAGDIYQTYVKGRDGEWRMYEFSRLAYHYQSLP